MSPKKKLESLSIRTAAKRVLESSGKNWKTLSAEDRSAQLRASRPAVTAADRRRAAIQLAKKQAKDAGFNWREISRERRQAMIKKIRSAARAR